MAQAARSSIDLLGTQKRLRADAPRMTIHPPKRWQWRTMKRAPTFMKKKPTEDQRQQSPIPTRCRLSLVNARDPGSKSPGTQSPPHPKRRAITHQRGRKPPQAATPKGEGQGPPQEHRPKHPRATTYPYRGRVSAEHHAWPPHGQGEPRQARGSRSQDQPDDCGT